MMSQSGESAGMAAYFDVSARCVNVTAQKSPLRSLEFATRV
jgi:hypothetical protein